MPRVTRTRNVEEGDGAIIGTTLWLFQGYSEQIVPYDLNSTCMLIKPHRADIVEGDGLYDFITRNWWRRLDILVAL
jgi:hypothetical protein